MKNLLLLSNHSPNQPLPRKELKPPFASRILALSDLSYAFTSTKIDTIPFHQVLKLSSFISSQEPPIINPHQLTPAPALVPCRPLSAGLSSVILLFPRLCGGVIIGEPLPKSTNSGLKVTFSTDKGKEKCLLLLNNLFLLVQNSQFKLLLSFIWKRSTGQLKLRFHISDKWVHFCTIQHVPY